MGSPDDRGSLEREIEFAAAIWQDVASATTNPSLWQQ